MAITIPKLPKTDRLPVGTAIAIIRNRDRHQFGIVIAITSER